MPGLNDSFPPAFAARMAELLGDEAPAFWAALNAPPRSGLRVNVLKLAPEDLRRRVPFALDPVPWCPAGFVVSDEARPGKHPYHAAGLYYLQEPSAMAVAETLDVRPGQRVLDLAAAPGGKATQIAALLGGAGLLVANELEPGRIKPLGENLERWGARNVVITNETPDRLAAELGPIFDRVLLDAPCSGEGMFRKNAAARAEWSLAHVAGCAARQSRILPHAARLVAPGGRLVYSTCTFAPEENEQRIADFLDEHPGWELEPIAAVPGWVPGVPSWAEPPRADLQQTVRLWPHRVAGEGHFIAALRRSQAQVPEQPTPRQHSPSLRHESTAVLASWQGFERDFLATRFPTEQLATRTDQLYLLPKALPNLAGLRVVRAGLWLGTSKPGRFEPSHALALALHADESRHTLPLQGDDLARYLRGEALRIPAAHDPDGWVLMTVDGFPIGWGRRVGPVVKNFYPKGLRWH